VLEESITTAGRHSDTGISSPLAFEICTALPIAPLTPVEIHRYLGYPRDVVPAPRMAEQIDSVVAEALACLQPRGVYSLYRLSDRSAHSLKLGNSTILGNIGEYLEHADHVAVFAVTVGNEISHLAGSAGKNGDPFSAWIMDAVGSWAAEGAADALMLRVRRHLRGGQDLTLRYSPGYCGMDIRQQAKLFQLMPADSVGVRLLPSMLMVPLKSISGLVGIAPQQAVSCYRSPCDICARVGCHMRR
jgi:hypothetical protein